MEILSFTLGANAIQQYRKAGSYLEILSSTGQIGINFYSVSGGQTDSIKNGLSGLYLNSDYGAFDIQDLSGSANVVQLLVCDAGEEGGSRRQPGNVRVIDEITDAITHANVTPPLTVAAQAFSLLLAPAANLKGVLVRGISGTAQANAAGSCVIGLLGCKSLPADLSTPAQRYAVGVWFSLNGQFVSTIDPHFNKLLPPGWGLYYYSAVSANNAQLLSAAIEYEILT